MAWEPSEAQTAFWRECAEQASESGEVTSTELRLLHGQGDTRTYGSIRLDGAFASCESLASACAFVRSQSFAAEADAAVLLVRKRDVVFPCVCYASLQWPEELGWDCEGFFAELVTREGTRTWFLPDLGAPMLLPQDCRLLEDALLPARSKDAEDVM
jgi:hypothetical protein